MYLSLILQEIPHIWLVDHEIQDYKCTPELQTDIPYTATMHLSCLAGLILYLSDLY